MCTETRNSINLVLKRVFKCRHLKQHPHTPLQLNQPVINILSTGKQGSTGVNTHKYTQTHAASNHSCSGGKKNTQACFSAAPHHHHPNTLLTVCTHANLKPLYSFCVCMRVVCIQNKAKSFGLSCLGWPTVLELESHLMHTLWGNTCVTLQNAPIDTSKQLSFSAIFCPNSCLPSYGHSSSADFSCCPSVWLHNLSFPPPPLFPSFLEPLRKEVEVLVSDTIDMNYNMVWSIASSQGFHLLLLNFFAHLKLIFT